MWSDPATTVGIPLQFVEQEAKLDFPPLSPDAFIERVDHLGVAAHNHEQARNLYVPEDFSKLKESEQLYERALQLELAVVTPERQIAVDA